MKKPRKPIQIIKTSVNDIVQDTEKSSTMWHGEQISLYLFGLLIFRYYCWSKKPPIISYTGNVYSQYTGNVYSQIDNTHSVIIGGANIDATYNNTKINPPQNINNCKPMEGKELDALNKALKYSNNTL